MKFRLSRMEHQDLDRLVPILYKAFAGVDFAVLYFGRASPSSYAICKRAFLQTLLRDTADVFLKIEDLHSEVDVAVLDEQGFPTRTEKRKRIVSCSDWKIYPTFVASNQAETAAQRACHTCNVSEREHSFPYLHTVQEQQIDAGFLLDNVLARRTRQAAEPQILLFMLFTDPEYQSKGPGRMMMRWGVKIADALMLPSWIEATPAGERLYKSMGYETKETVEVRTQSFHLKYLHMRRPPIVSSIELEPMATQTTGHLQERVVRTLEST